MKGSCPVLQRSLSCISLASQYPELPVVFPLVGVAFGLAVGHHKSSNVNLKPEAEPEPNPDPATDRFKQLHSRQDTKAPSASFSLRELRARGGNLCSSPHLSWVAQGHAVSISARMAGCTSLQHVERAERDSRCLPNSNPTPGRSSTACMPSPKP